MLRRIGRLPPDKGVEIARQEAPLGGERVSLCLDERDWSLQLVPLLVDNAIRLGPTPDTEISWRNRSRSSSAANPYSDSESSRATRCSCSPRRRRTEHESPS